MRLPSKVRLAIIRSKERTDRTVVVECDERAGRAVEACDHAVSADGFEDVAADRGVAEPLRAREIFGAGNCAKLLPVFLEVFGQLVGGVETDKGFGRFGGFSGFGRCSRFYSRSGWSRALRRAGLALDAPARDRSRNRNRQRKRENLHVDRAFSTL